MVAERPRNRVLVLGVIGRVPGGAEDHSVSVRPGEGEEELGRVGPDLVHPTVDLAPLGTELVRRRKAIELVMANQDMRVGRPGQVVRRKRGQFDHGPLAGQVEGRTGRDLRHDSAPVDLRCNQSAPGLPETTERVFGDVVQCLVRRHDHGAEVADLVPAVAVAPPQYLDLVALAGRTQSGHGFASVLAEERVALGSFLDQDTAAVGCVEGFDAGQEVVGLLHGLSRCAFATTAMAGQARFRTSRSESGKRGNAFLDANSLYSQGNEQDQELGADRVGVRSIRGRRSHAGSCMTSRKAALVGNVANRWSSGTDPIPATRQACSRTGDLVQQQARHEESLWRGRGFEDLTPRPAPFQVMRELWPHRRLRAPANSPGTNRGWQQNRYHW